MRTAEQRIAKYNAKTDPATVRLKRLAMLPTMMANYATYVRESVPKEEATRSILDEEGVSSIMLIFYHNFSRKLYRYSKQSSGGALAREAEIHVATWVAYGMERHILERIRTEVWNIGPPPTISGPVC
ncbi:hypothetical protein CH330_05940 [candidate division WOR-3 bacterium JGI_Cruoil_03_51_56]|uniref:Uncharacterized protein n=1 Tax=candidate division WOR-3 bacterium JGI_Cruoil_03_51_56 TaxID=1973747 RepID=A0A235BUA4_UNCW3|nr:MAG: hypothetical protein CH330_05940 [candidate division WOR-3 bacterium JGI_Cruoil_03_51_56]